MSQANVEIIRREYAAFAAGDWDALANIWHPEIHYESLDPATYRGREELSGLFETWNDIFEEFRIRADEIVEVGDRVVVLERFSGRGMKGSHADAWVEQSLARLIDFKEGKIWRVKEYPTLDEAVQAAAPR